MWHDLIGFGGSNEGEIYFGAPLSLVTIAFCLSNHVPVQATVKLYVAAQNVAAHREFDKGKKDKQAMTRAELNKTIGGKGRLRRS